MLKMSSCSWILLGFIANYHARVKAIGPFVAKVKAKFELNDDHHRHCHDKTFGKFLDSDLEASFERLDIDLHKTNAKHVGTGSQQDKQKFPFSSPMYKITGFFDNKIQFPVLPSCIYYDLLQVMNIDAGCDFTSSQLHSTRVLSRAAEATISPDFSGMSGKGRKRKCE